LLHASGLFAGIRKKRDLAGVLDGLAQRRLVLPAVARDPAGPYLASLREEAAQRRDILVIDVVDLFLAEVAVLPLLPALVTRALLFAFFVAFFIGGTSLVGYGSNTSFRMATTEPRRGSR
jgi:hypothetical protein